MAQSLTINNRTYVPAAEVGKQFGYTRDYILLLAREGKLEGEKVNNRWFIDIESAKTFFKSSEVEREERRAQLREERRQEFISRTRAREHARASRARKSLRLSTTFEAFAVLVLMTLVGLAAHVGVRAYPMGYQAAAIADDGAAVQFIERFAATLYDFFTETDSYVSSESVTEIVGTPAPFPSKEGALSTSTADSSPLEHGSSSFEQGVVAVPEATLSPSLVRDLEQAFSDETTVTITEDGDDTGTIVPHFKDGDGKPYRFFMIPRTEGEEGEDT